jgi:hypothetical protein
MLSLVITFRPILVAARPLGCWGYWFEYRLRHGGTFIVVVVCFVGSGLCDGLITGTEKSYWVCLRSRNFKMRRPGPDLGCSFTDKIKLHFINWK